MSASEVAKKRAARLIGEMKEARGYMYPSHEYLAAHDPDFLVDYNRLVGRALRHGSESNADRALPAKYVELIVVGVLCFRAASQDAVRTHMRRALALGATRREILEALEAAMVPGGAPTLIYGVGVLMQLDDSEKASI